MKMPFPDNQFDGVYAIEATCHAPDRTKVGTQAGPGAPLPPAL
jgi:hypothetical protein